MIYNFMFNKNDNSYAYHSENTIPEFMIDESQFVVQIDVDLNNYKDITLVSWDNTTESLIDESDLWIRVKTEEGKVKLEGLLKDDLEYITKENNPTRYAEMLTLARIAFDAEKINEIFGDDILTDEEAQEILNAL